MISRLCLFKITWIWLISDRSFRSKICFFDIEASLREVFSTFDCRERVLLSMPTSLLSSNKIEEPGLGAGGPFHLRGYCTDMPSESRNAHLVHHTHTVLWCMICCLVFLLLCLLLIFLMIMIMLMMSIMCAGELGVTCHISYVSSLACYFQVLNQMISTQPCGSSP